MTVKELKEAPANVPDDAEVYMDDCCSPKFGLGCFKGKNIKIEK